MQQKINYLGKSYAYNMVYEFNNGAVIYLKRLKQHIVITKNRLSNGK